jgi:hypothetical protein
MTLATIREQVSVRLADAVGAVARYPILPEEPPQRLPAVVTKWTTAPVRVRYGSVPTGARHRQHNIDATVIIAQRRMMPDEDAAAMTLAEAVMDSFEDDGRLDEEASRCSLDKVEPFTLQYGEAQQSLTYFCLRCTFTVLETTT